MTSSACKLALALTALLAFGQVPHARQAVRVENGVDPAVAIAGEPARTLRERMQHHGVPGLGIAVIHDGKVAWFRTYGVTDRESGAPVTADTRFQAGSVSKPVAAFGALAMVGRGELALDGDVNARLRGWKIPTNELTEKRPVTLAHLLGHTAGMTVHGFPGYAAGRPVPTLRQVLDGSRPARTAPILVDTEPGSAWRYSGGGYTVVQQLMIDVAGEPFPELMRARVLEPLGMRRSTYEQPLPSTSVRDAAAGHLPDGSPVAGRHHTYPELAAAGLWTTAGDLARFAVEVQLALRGKGKILSRTLAEALVEPVAGGHGLGFAVSDRDGQRYFTHGGWNAGFCANLTAHRDDGYGVAVTINSNHPAFIDEVIRIVAETYGWRGYPGPRRNP